MKNSRVLSPKKFFNVNELYKLQNYVSSSGLFFTKLKESLDRTDTTNEFSLEDFYVDIRLLYDNFKKEVGVFDER